ncbi:MAG: SDR family oxidoreductase [Intrasporangium sp.]|uniref:SDR family oxidoreductase n=1 Tax=Intrasporangium sp. TaxID=1925024 RepID=UPI00264A4111|nr:SDR family oxidoreductase [Intrasporangium sp.]MDN5796054.1 SDR family oxidoreductase [Intrasporangium sp.]
MSTDPQADTSPSMQGQRVLVAGATGYLGRNLVSALLDAGCRVRVLVRRPEQADTFPGEVDAFVGQVTDPATLTGVTDEIDMVFSALGITRQRDGVKYLDVDYRGNLALLHLAEQTGVARFVYVSLLHGRDLRNSVRLATAKEKFVDALTASSVPSVVVRPTGYFSDMGEFLTMAGRGVVSLIGDGQLRINPISGRDAAAACVDAARSAATEVQVGGPDVYTYEAIARAAFAAHRGAPRIRHLPRGLAVAAVWVLAHCTPEHVYGPLQFLIAVMTHEMTAPPTGSDHLTGYFAQQSAGAGESVTAHDAPTVG